MKSFEIQYSFLADFRLISNQSKSGFHGPSDPLCCLFPPVGSSAGQVDVSREHLRMCVHLRERRVVLRHSAVGDLLIG